MNISFYSNGWFREIYLDLLQLFFLKTFDGYWLTRKGDSISYELFFVSSVVIGMLCLCFTFIFLVSYSFYVFISYSFFFSILLRYFLRRLNLGIFYKNLKRLVFCQSSIQWHQSFHKMRVVQSKQTWRLNFNLIHFLGQNYFED